MKDRVWNYILGVLLILFGISFIIYPNSAFGTIVLVAGAVIIAFSTLKLVLTLRSNAMPSFFAFTSVIGIIFGIVLINNTEKSIEVVTFLLGLWFLVGGVSSLLVLVRSNASKKELYKPIFKIIIGTVAFIAPVIITFAAGYVVGVILIISGVSTFINYVDEDKVVYKVKVKK